MYDEGYEAYIRDIIKRILSIVLILAFGILFFFAWRAGDSGYLQEQMQAEFSTAPMQGTDAAAPADSVLVFAGEVNLDERYNALVPEAVNSPAACIEDHLIAMFTEADLFMASNGFAFTEVAVENAYRTDPENAVFWSKMGVDLLSLAGKNSRTYGEGGVAETKAVLADEKIETVEDLYIAKLHGKQIAIVVADLTAESALSACLDTVQTAEADAVIAYVHFGEEHAAEPSEAQISAARALADAGADVVIGTQTHTLQTIEHYNGTPIFYGIGDLWCGSAPGESAAVRVTVTAEGSVQTEVIPCINVGSRTYIAPDERGEEILQRLNLSETAAIGADGAVTAK